MFPEEVSISLLMESRSRGGKAGGRSREVIRSPRPRASAFGLHTGYILSIEAR